MALLTRWDPFEDLASIQSTMDRLFDQVFPTREGLRGRVRGAQRYYLPTDVEDTGQTYRITAPLPGFKPEEVEVTFHDGSLRISAHHSGETETREGTYLRREVVSGDYGRTIALPSQVQGDQIKASFQDGMLTVDVPKQPGTRPLRIAIGSGNQKGQAQLPGGDSR